MKNYIDTIVPENYLKIWNDIMYEQQYKKLSSRGTLVEDTLDRISKRAYFMVKLARHYGSKNIAEVGTATGWQFYSFGEYLSSENKDGKIFSCDIKDVRNSDYVNKYDVCDFTLGDSSHMSNKIKDSGRKIDMFWIDGDHVKGAVPTDISNLAEHQSEYPVWIFDDYDNQFGVFEDLNNILEKVSKREKDNNIKIIEQNTNNHMLIWEGRFDIS